MEDIQRLDGRVLAISTDSVEANRALVGRLGLDFPVLSDPELLAIDAYGLRHSGGDPMKGADIARPGVFAIDREGRVSWSYLTDNWRVRARPEGIVERLKAIP
ncbi:MAG: peroxiredoxin [Planctomycetota bacterium]|jgi:peroxiredoxin